MAFDRMDWHYGGDYPRDLPTENGGTHIGMFLAWVIEHGLVGSLHIEESEAALKKLGCREITGRDFLITECDEKFWDEDLSDEGLAFTKDYYETGSSFAKQHNDYLQDYCELHNNYAETNGFEYESLYHVENTWINYDKLKPIIDNRYAQWKIWKSNPVNLSLDPHAQFLNACALVAEQYLSLGFKATQKGKTLKKTSKDKDLTFSIVFEKNCYNSCNDVKMSVYCTIHSKKTKKWMFEQTQNKYGEGLVHHAYLKKFVKQNNPEWHVAGSSLEPSIKQIIRAIEQQFLPVLEMFEQPSKAAIFLANHGTLFTEFSESESYPLAYLLCMGYKNEAEKFLNFYLASLPKPWQSNLKNIYNSLPNATSINLNLSECGGAIDVKLAYIHGLKLTTM